jgi:hypothetical protein
MIEGAQRKANEAPGESIDRLTRGNRSAPCLS